MEKVKTEAKFQVGDHVICLGFLHGIVTDIEAGTDILYHVAHIANQDKTWYREVELKLGWFRAIVDSPCNPPEDEPKTPETTQGRSRPEQLIEAGPIGQDQNSVETRRKIFGLIEAERKQQDEKW